MLTNFLGKVTCFASEGLGCVGHGGGLMGLRVRACGRCQMSYRLLRVVEIKKAPICLRQPKPSPDPKRFMLGEIPGSVCGHFEPRLVKLVVIGESYEH